MTYKSRFKKSWNSSATVRGAYLPPLLASIAAHNPEPTAESLPPKIKRPRKNALPDERVLEIRAYHEFLGISTTEIAKMFGIAYARASYICNYIVYFNLIPKPEQYMDKTVKAVCACGIENKETTFRKLKNKWPTCRCKQPMKVLSEKSNSQGEPEPEPDVPAGDILDAAE